MTFNPVKSDKQHLSRGVRFLRCESEGILESFHNIPSNIPRSICATSTRILVM